MMKRRRMMSSFGMNSGRVTGKPGIILAAVLLALSLVSVVRGQGGSGPEGAEAAPIAYVNAATGDEIRLVQADGSNDRQLWTHGKADTEGEFEVWSLSWRPDGDELAFASTHEKLCSTNYADVYTMGSGGGGLRRVTEAPSCATLAGYGKGTVRVPVENNSIFNEHVDVTLYFQGAPGPQEVSLAPGSRKIVVFEDVADLGGMVQFAVEIQGADRWVHASSGIDVRAGEAVETSTVYVPGGVVGGHEARWPTWQADGNRLGYVTGFNSILGIDPQPAPLTAGNSLLATGGQMPDFVNHLAWGPPGTRENQLLYASYEAFDSTSIYLATIGSQRPGQALVSFDASTFVHFILGLAWLPDGSGFVYSVLEDDFYTPVSANIYLYEFATGQSTPVTAFDETFAGMLSVSPDGQEIVYEYGSMWSGDSLRVENPQLWIVGRNGGNGRLLVENGRAPAWSPEGVPDRPTLDETTYLPMILGD